WKLEIWCAAPTAIRHLQVAMVQKGHLDATGMQACKEVGRLAAGQLRKSPPVATQPDATQADEPQGPSPHPDWDDEIGVRLLDELRAERAKADAIDNRSRCRSGSGTEVPLPPEQAASHG